MRPLQGLVCGEMRVCGAGCCGKWKSENALVQGLGPHTKIVKKDTTNPLNIGDERILGVKPSL